MGPDSDVDLRPKLSIYLDTSCFSLNHHVTSGPDTYRPIISDEATQPIKSMDSDKHVDLVALH